MFLMGLPLMCRTWPRSVPRLLRAQQVRQQPRRNADLPAAFFGPRATGNVEVDQTRFKVHLCPPQR